MPYTIVETSTWTTAIEAPTTGDTHMQNRTAFQAVGNRLKYVKDRIDAGFERPIRVMTQAAMVALAGMANNDQVYAKDTQRLYYWDSASNASVNAPFVLAGSSGPPGRWIAFDRPSREMVLRATATPALAALTTSASDVDLTGMSVTLTGSLLTGDVVLITALLPQLFVTGTVDSIILTALYNNGGDIATSILNFTVQTSYTSANYGAALVGEYTLAAPATNPTVRLRWRKGGAATNIQATGTGYLCAEVFRS